MIIWYDNCENMQGKNFTLFVTLFAYLTRQKVQKSSVNFKEHKFLGTVCAKKLTMDDEVSF
jgi:hypothetical protein